MGCQEINEPWPEETPRQSVEPSPGSPLAESTVSEEQLCFAELQIPTQPCKALRHAQAQAQSRYLLMGYGLPKPLWLLEIPSSARLRQHTGSPPGVGSPHSSHACPDPQKHGPSSAPQCGSGPQGPTTLQPRHLPENCVDLQLNLKFLAMASPKASPEGSRGSTGAWQGG